MASIAERYDLVSGYCFAKNYMAARQNRDYRCRRWMLDLGSFSCISQLEVINSVERDRDEIFKSTGWELMFASDSLFFLIFSQFEQYNNAFGFKYLFFHIFFLVFYRLCGVSVNRNYFGCVISGFSLSVKQCLSTHRECFPIVFGQPA